MSGEFNTTSLTERSHGHAPHRDYIAHAFRWSVAQRHIRPGMRVLDVGCGPDLPLLKVLSHFPHPTSVPQSYVGIDLNRFEPGRLPKWATVMTGTNVFEVDPAAVGPADVVVCFEMIEHMSQPRGIQLLEWLWDAVDDQGIVLLSTPSYAGGRLPVNHVYEWEYQELMDTLVGVNFKVDRVWGTFMRIPRLRRALEMKHPALLPVLDQLEEYYSNEALSTIFAPLFPEVASNCLWRLRKIRCLQTGKPVV